MAKRQSFYIFVKAQTSAFTGGIVDYLIMVMCTEFLHIHYTVSILISGIVGAVVNFSINKYWTFRGGSHHHSVVSGQLLKFCMVVAGSILLKSSGTYLISTGIGIDYKISRLIIDLIVSLGFNYVLQKYWVFRIKKPESPAGN